MSSRDSPGAGCPSQQRNSTPWSTKAPRSSGRSGRNERGQTMTMMMNVGSTEGQLRRAYLEWRDGPGGAAAMPLFRKLALARADSGRRFGIKALIEVVRWELGGNIPHDKDGFKINNSIAPYLARDLIADYPHLADFIELRRVSDEPYGRQRAGDEPDDREPICEEPINEELPF